MSWGFGAVRVDTPPKGWVCPVCGRPQRRKHRSRHVYLFGPALCSECAAAFHDFVVHTPDPYGLGHQEG